MSKTIAEINVSLAKHEEKREKYRLPITIFNKSSMGFQKAEVAVKDEGTNTVDTVYFGNIPAGESAVEYADLPGGIESCIWKILPDIGDEIYGFGVADNAGGVNLTITD
ncbi:MAG: hypothetical protein P8176_16110 [Gammaproteobacteria bacterium]